MNPSLKNLSLALPAGLLALSAHALPSVHPTPAIHDRVDNAQRVVLGGNTRPEAHSAADLGRLPDDRRLPALMLQLKRSPEGEAALAQFVADLHDPASAEYHHWLTPAQFAEHFGVAASDVAAVSGWLRAQGLRVGGVAPTGLQIEFSGTAGQLRRAFGTEIHEFSVQGVTHFANKTDPRIPAALRPAVEGIVALHDFAPTPLSVPRGPSVEYTFTTSQGTHHGLVAADLATIYNFKPLFAAGLTGQGQTIMVLEDTYLYSTADWTRFRDEFGLTATYPQGTLAQVSPQGAMNCRNPGFQGTPILDKGYGHDSEAAIDVEWATAAAPNAAIVLAACTTGSTFGGLIALQNTLNGPASGLPSVISMSYGEAEAVSGAALNASFNTTYQQAVAEGVSMFVSSGDQLAASADPNAPATHGIAVSGWASSPFDVAVGGTDFSYRAKNVDPSTYWSDTNDADGGSALSYMAEIPWNNSCAGSMYTAFLGTTPDALCNDPTVTDKTGSRHRTLAAAGGSGGPSGCATGQPSTKSVVSGTCAGYAKPSWQAGIFGNPKDGVRDLPDVSLFASNGFWDAYYITCWSNPDKKVQGGGKCTGTPGTWPGFGGTSVSSPIMAGIQALVNEKTGSRWGNPNTVYYKLATAEYGKKGSAACNSSTVDKTSNSCKFYDITEGDSTAVCAAATDGTLRDCFIATPGMTYGALSTSGTTDQPAYRTTTGWDFATGIGSVNAFNLVMGWPTH